MIHKVFEIIEYNNRKENLVKYTLMMTDFSFFRDK